MNSTKPILLIEDDQIDRMTVQRSFKNLNIKNPLSVACNGEEGLHLIQNTTETPCLIILDINMPKMNGIEFLKIIKADPNFKTIPVVILTTSNDENDKFICYSYGAAGYIIKPIDYNEFQEAIRIFNNYWNINQFVS